MADIRLLQPEDIDVRVARTNNYNKDGQMLVKAELLLYKDARVDMKILDELYTPMGWKRTHKLIGDRLYCCVEVWNKDLGQWVAKEDVGTESNTEAEKGQASDSFKRACFNWGIGRELYSASRISIVLNQGEFAIDQYNKAKVYATFSVKSIGYDKDSRTITSLEIVDKYGNVRYTMGAAPAPAVKARRAAKANAVAAVAYKPLSEEAYWQVVERFAKGLPTKTGGDCRQWWIEHTSAGAEQIAKFDNDVQNYKFANNI